MAVHKKGAGAYPQADPTAPGGMSKADLRLELAEQHGCTMAESREMSWPDLIQAVIDGRLSEEAADLVDAIEHAEGMNLNEVALLGWDEDMARDEREKAEVNQGFADLANAVGPGKLDGSSDLDLPQPDEEGELFDPEMLYAEIVAAQAEHQSTLPPPLFLGIPGIKDYVFSGHAGAGPSASERWMTCTMALSASRAFLETLSPNQQVQYAGANLAARQGTTAHAAAEAEANHMLGRIDDTELQAALLELMIEPEDSGEAYDDEMGEYITEYTELIRSYATERGTEAMLIESRVESAIPLADLHEGEVYIIRGSADMIAMPTDDDPVLVVGDLKYGNGIWVDVDENSQARIYALGALDLLTDDEGNLITNVERVRLHIVQPRLGGIKTWEESLDDLLDWRDDVLSPALTKALYGQNEGATYQPSETACQFCPARGGCPALTAQRIEQAADLFDVIVESEFEGTTFPETTALPDDRLGELLAQITGLIDIHKDLKEEAQRRLHRGGTVPGYQLVSYTPPRKWKEGTVEWAAGRKGLADLWKPPTLVTPTQALKVLGDNAKSVERWIDAPDKRPVVAPVGDRRKPWTGTPPEQMFPDLPETESSSTAGPTAEEMFPDA